MQAALNGASSNEELFTRLVTAIRESGAVDDALKEAKQFVERSLIALKDFPAGPERQALEDLAKYVVDREI